MKFNAHKNRFTFAILSERPCSVTFLQNPDNGFGSERPLDRDDVRRLVRSDLDVEQMLLKGGGF